MLHLIERLVPRPLHRAALRLAHNVRHRWRVFRKVPLAGVSIIATDAQGRVLLVRHSYGPDYWALPGGGLKRGEDARAAARRELLEEVGCDASDVRIVGSQDEVISGSPHTAYIVRMLVEGDVLPDKREVVEAGFFALDALPRPLSGLTRTRLDFWRAAEEGRSEVSGQ